jgi:hypothetical protein
MTSAMSGACTGLPDPPQPATPSDLRFLTECRRFRYDEMGTVLGGF